MCVKGVCCACARACWGGRLIPTLSPHTLWVTKTQREAVEKGAHCRGGLLAIKAEQMIKLRRGNRKRPAQRLQPESRNHFSKAIWCRLRLDYALLLLMHWGSLYELQCLHPWMTSPSRLELQRIAEIVIRNVANLMSCLNLRTEKIGGFALFKTPNLQRSCPCRAEHMATINHTWAEMSSYDFVNLLLWESYTQELISE